MIEPSIPNLPEGLHASLSVLASEGPIGRKTWLLRDDVSGELYRVTPDCVAAWKVPIREESVGPSIILSLAVDGSLTALHLPTGEVYRVRGYSGLQP